MTETKAIQKRKILRHPTNNGWVVEIPVSDDPNGPTVTVDTTDWDVLCNVGIYPLLTLEKDKYPIVWCPQHRRYVHLRRLIMNANSDQSVSTKDGNELNLVRSNLEIYDRKPPIYDRSYLCAENKHYYDLVEYETDYNTDPIFNTYLKRIRG